MYPSGVLRDSGPLMESSTGHRHILVLILTAQDKRRSESQTCPWTAIRPQALVGRLCSRRYLNNSLLSHIVVQFVQASPVGEDLYSFFFLFFPSFCRPFQNMHWCVHVPVSLHLGPAPARYVVKRDIRLEAETEPIKKTVSMSFMFGRHFVFFSILDCLNCRFNVLVL